MADTLLDPAIARDRDVQVVEEFFKAHVPVAVWESALGYADAVVEEWEVAAGGVSQREKARRSRTVLTALLEGDSSALMQQGGLERLPETLRGNLPTE
ncbi:MULTISPECIES: hypothetical protein [unclassified Corynebacterium]|uniref:hypothetical protein n=1 Tax=unclassified Corynebacterium TaxID=2624378 RepID=UPI0029C9B679|nr:MULTISPECIES: hypothetical protein [unclassified Corynebacterium]WPF66680.1 hypothetical protein OLX12_02820 [Corynebacterium sp. 22KM0430]WPF69167.1 hypothetical protein OLW90_02815 [Corynebacterium sp. 21KM1197]